jgi:hypothetical protein
MKGTKSCFFENINKIDISLSKIRREKTQISKIRNAKYEITTNSPEIQASVSKYHYLQMTQSYTSKTQKTLP